MKALFIVGYWNSGTTLLVDVLRKHPALMLRRARYKPNLEERTIKKILRSLGTDFWDFKDYSGVIANGFEGYEEPKFDAAQRRAFRRKFIWNFWIPKSKMLLLKNPWLFFFKDFIEENFADDDLKKIVILRNGYSQAVSKDYWKIGNDAPEKHLLARTLFWKKSMERYFETWYNDPNCLTIRYENLCTHPEKTIRKVCEFLNLPLEPLQQQLPAAFENRMTKWLELDAALQQEVRQQIDDIQNRIDTAFPIE